MSSNNTTILEGIIGSQAHGLVTADSDTDYIGIFVAPTSEIAGFNWSTRRESIVTKNPDRTMHEVGKYLRLALKGNPTIIELLFLDDYTIMSSLGYHLVENRSKFLAPQSLFYSYIGYARSQLSKFRNSYGRSKYLKHALRLTEQCRDLLETGEFSLRVKDTAPYDYITSTHHVVSDEDKIKYVDEKINTLYREGPAIVKKSPLQSFDRNFAIDLLLEIRKYYI